MTSDKSIQMNRLDQKGMTLLETLVALGIFSTVVVVTTGLFISGIKAQTRASEMNLLNNEASFILERMGREMRVAWEVDNMRISSANGAGDDSEGPRIQFTNHDNMSTVYCLSSETGTCQNSGQAVSVSYDNGASFLPITSPNVELVNLLFSSNGDPSTLPPTQKIITIFLELQSKRDPSVSVKLQTSVVPRVY